MKYLLYNQNQLLPVWAIPFIILALTMTTMNSQAQTLETVRSVDLKKYSGKWYEIDSYLQYFQKGCHCTTAKYTLTEQL